MKGNEIMSDAMEKMREGENNLFSTEPRLNVISKEAYEKRIEKVFKLLWQTLSKSFGPYGAPTLIYNFPYSHVTKDGYTIMKNLSMDTSKQLVDEAIKQSAADICGRLNYAVGDGTTSAVIATYSIYQNYLKNKKSLTDKLLLPRDILQAFSDVKTDIINELRSYVKSIRSNDPDELYHNIYEIVYISSNGDEQLSSYIASLYKELQFPGISCELSPDGVTRKRLIEGYEFSLILNDRMYINNDDDTMTVNNADVVMFSVKINKEIYERILKPLNMQSEARGRKLIVCATAYDETALLQTIRRDLNNEYQKNNGTINMVLCTYRSISQHTRNLASDFAMLCNTIIIDRSLRDSIYDQLDKGVPIWKIFNIDARNNIPNLRCVGESLTRVDQNGKPEIGLYVNGQYDPNLIKPLFADVPDDAIRLGYIGSGSIGLKNSVFTDFYYDKARYTAVMKEAEAKLKEAESSAATKMGTFSLVVNQCQQRLYALKLKRGVIEIGADSELSQKMLRDSADDAVKAASSAFDHGIILGCNVDLVGAINKVLLAYANTDKIDNEIIKSMYITVLTILRDGFTDVYKTVLMNAFPNSVLIKAEDVDKLLNATSEDNNNENTLSRNYSEDACNELVMNIKKSLKKSFFTDVDISAVTPVSIAVMVSRLSSNSRSNGENGDVMLYDFITEYSQMTESVFDVSTRGFSNTVINSFQTDEEILTATIDLISLLITGNQMLITQKPGY